MDYEMAKKIIKGCVIMLCCFFCLCAGYFYGRSNRNNRDGGQINSELSDTDRAIEESERNVEELLQQYQQAKRRFAEHSEQAAQ